MRITAAMVREAGREAIGEAQYAALEKQYGTVWFAEQMAKALNHLPLAITLEDQLRPDSRCVHGILLTDICNTCPKEMAQQVQNAINAPAPGL